MPPKFEAMYNAYRAIGYDHALAWNLTCHMQHWGML